MVQLVMHLPHRREALSPDPQHSYKKLGMCQCVHVTLVPGGVEPFGSLIAGQTV